MVTVIQSVSEKTGETEYPHLFQGTTSEDSLRKTRDSDKLENMKTISGRTTATPGRNARKCHPARTGEAMVEVSTISDEEFMEEVERIRAVMAICRQRAERLIEDHFTS